MSISVRFKTDRGSLGCDTPSIVNNASTFASICKDGGVPKVADPSTASGEPGLDVPGASMKVADQPGVQAGGGTPSYTLSSVGRQGPMVTAFLGNIDDTKFALFGTANNTSSRAVPGTSEDTAG